MQGTHDIDETTTADDGDGLDPREAAQAARSDQAGRAAPVRPQPAVDHRGDGRRGPRRLRRAVALDARTASLQRSERRRGRAGVRGGGRLDRRVREGLPARDRRRQRAVGETAAGRGGRDPDLVHRQPRDSGRDEALRRQPRDRLRGDPGRGAADHRRHDRAGHRGQQGRLAPVRRRARGRHRRRRRRCSWDRAAAWLAAGIGLFIAVVGYAAATRAAAATA